VEAAGAQFMGVMQAGPVSVIHVRHKPHGTLPDGALASLFTSGSRAAPFAVSGSAALEPERWRRLVRQQMPAVLL
jgi:hypothetical protein